MPGVLMLEALAQAAALLSFETWARARRQHGRLLRRHRRRALQAAGRAGRPADAGSRRSTAHQGAASRSSRRAALVDGELAAEAELMCTMRKVGLSHARRRMATIHPTAHRRPEGRARRRSVDGRRRTPSSARTCSIGAGTTIGAHCVIEGRTTIGRDNRIFQFCSLGGAPQDKKYAGEPTGWRSATATRSASSARFNTGTVQDAGVTRVGDDNWIMAYVHIAHDCQRRQPHDPGQQRCSWPATCTSATG